MSTPMVVVFEALGRHAAVAVDEPVLAEAVGALFPAYRTATPSPRDVTGALAVSRHAGGLVLTDGDGTAHRCETLVDLLSACEFAVTRRLLAGHQGLLPLHASGAVVRGRAVLALGRSGAGKSSLGMSWLRSGYPGLGDDAVLVGDDGRAHPFKRLYEIDAALLPTLGVTPEETVFWQPGSTEAWYDPGSGAGWGEPAPIGIVAAVRYRAHARLTMEPLSAAATLNVLTHSLMDTVHDRAAAVEALARVVPHATGFEVTFGSAAEAAAALAERMP